MGQQSGGSTNQTTTSLPDPVTQAWRQNIFDRGTGLIDQGAPSYYPGSTVAPLSTQTQSAAQQMQTVAAGGVPNLGAATDANARALSGYNPGIMPAMGAALGADSTAGKIAPVLSQFMGATNPYLDKTYQQGAEDVTNGVNAQFAKAGRFGANASLGAGLSKGLGSLYTGIYAPAYESNMNRGLQAAGIYNDTLTADANRKLAGASAAGSLYSQANQDASTATGNLGTIYGDSLQPALTEAAAGSIYDDQTQKQTDADVARYNYTQNAPWQYLQQFSSMMNGLPDFATTMQSGTAAPVNNTGAYLGAGATVAASAITVF